MARPVSDSPIQLAQQLQAAVHWWVPPGRRLPCCRIRRCSVGGSPLLARLLLGCALLLPSGRLLLIGCCCCCRLLLCLLQALWVVEILWLGCKPSNLLPDVGLSCAMKETVI